MNAFFEILIILVLSFLFSGEPDLWDALHDRAVVMIQDKK
ncbi:hypothetical protein UFOVP1309_82 [uncultured Caudovirales phage]|uniref:Uncharacterized protein n=1 Tax=uncultured Caudovirales phage TaxID=2100421 RepID=A0A6J5S0M0_9CAUD|nr:hypothetical protein UFOVP1309_82 [uncultured Caudovirales phage]